MVPSIEHSFGVQRVTHITAYGPRVWLHERAFFAGTALQVKLKQLSSWGNFDKSLSDDNGERLLSFEFPTFERFENAIACLCDVHLTEVPLANLMEKFQNER